MKVLIHSLMDTRQIKKILEKYSFEIVKKNPDFILCYGGDGTVLHAERTYPGIPKLSVKKSTLCRKCDFTFEQLDRILREIKKGNYTIEKEMKLETKFKNKKLVALNEIQIHAKSPIHALRFSFIVDGREFKNLVGDGIIIATPFGSTAYYKSTGGEPFEDGIGISFNNLHNQKIGSFVVPSNSVVKIKIDRERAWIIADNYEKFIEMKEGDRITIRKSKEIARFIDKK